MKLKDGVKVLSSLSLTPYLGSPLTLLKGDGTLAVFDYNTAISDATPSFLWGGSEANNYSRYNPAKFAVDKATKATKDGDGNTISSTYLKLSGGNMTGSIKSLPVGGGIYWNPYVESATDGSDAASITVLKTGGPLGGTTLRISLQNDATDTIQFSTNASAKLYHNSNYIYDSGIIETLKTDIGLSNYLTTTDNAASATKLANARNIWGLSFNGTNDVDGTLILGATAQSGNNFNEGIRINKAWGNPLIHFGGAVGSTTGTGTNLWTIGMHGTDYFALTTNTWNNTIIAARPGGNVGIGINNPSDKFHVLGTFRQSNEVSGTYTNTSDSSTTSVKGDLYLRIYQTGGNGSGTATSPTVANLTTYSDYSTSGDYHRFLQHLIANSSLTVNGTTTLKGEVRIGATAAGPNFISFYGTTGDLPGYYTHTYIGERIWGSSERSELVLFKGNDIGNTASSEGSGPDRIRHIAAAHLFQIYNSALSGTFAGICASTVPVDILEVNKSGIVVTGKIVKKDGTSTLFLKADGTVDSNTYLTTSGKAADSSKLDGVTKEELFTDLSNSGNNLSVTIGGTNKTLTVGYATKSKYPDGFNSSNNTFSWGTLGNANNGYTKVVDWSTSGGSEISFAEKSGALSVQIDGFFYQREGGKRVADLSDLTWTNIANKPTTISGYGITDAINYTAVNLHTTNDVNYPIVWSNLNNTTNSTSNLLYKSHSDLYYNPKNKKLYTGGLVATVKVIASSDAQIGSCDIVYDSTNKCLNFNFV